MNYSADPFIAYAIWLEIQLDHEESNIYGNAAFGFPPGFVWELMGDFVFPKGGGI